MKPEAATKPDQAALSQGPLTDIRVLDMTRLLAGPFCTLMLGDMGAEVVKIERPGGEENRSLGTAFSNGFSAFSVAINRNKRSVELDLRDKEDRKLFFRLVSAADVIVENFRPGVMDRLGFGYEDLRAINPRLIYASISAFGPDGPDHDRPGYDGSIQAEAGLMEVNSDGVGPRSIPLSILDTCTGMFTAYGILAAIHARRTTGRGQRIDTSLLGTAIGLMNGHMTAYFMTGRPPDTVTPGRFAYGLPTRDGRLMMGFMNDTQFKEACSEMGLDHLPEDPRFATPSARTSNNAELVPLISERLAQETTEYWTTRFRRRGVIYGQVKSLTEAFQHPQVLASGLVVDQLHPVAGGVRMQPTPIRLSETPATIRRHAPSLDEDRSEVLSSWLS